MSRIRIYPYQLDHPCPTCGSPIIIKRKRKKIADYCSSECYNATIQKHPKIITQRTCPHCSKKFNHHKNQFCSKKCSNGYRASLFPERFRTCLHCQKQYQILKELGNNTSKYCSRLCFTQAKITKYRLDLSQLSQPHLLGQIWATALIKDLLEIRLYASLEVMQSMVQKLATDYPIKGTRSEVWDNFFETSHTITIFNRQMISNLLDLGLESPLYRTWPIISDKSDSQFFQAYCDSVRKIIKEDQIWVWMISKDMSRAAQDKFGGEIIYQEGDWWWISKILI